MPGNTPTAVERSLHLNMGEFDWHHLVPETPARPEARSNLAKALRWLADKLEPRI